MPFPSSLKGKTILIVGGTCFTAKHLIKRLSPDNQIIATFRNPDKRRDVDGKRISVNDIQWIPFDCNANEFERFEMTLFDNSLSFVLKEIDKKLDAIIYLSMFHSKEPETRIQCYNVNIRCFMHFLELARTNNVPKFLFTSSGSIYGISNRINTEETPIMLYEDLDFYSSTKYIAEILLKTYSPFFKYGIFRINTPYGPGQEKGLIYNLIKKVKNGETIEITNDGIPFTCPIYIDNEIDALEYWLYNGADNIILNVCGSEIMSIQTLVYLIANTLHKNVNEFMNSAQIKRIIKKGEESSGYIMSNENLRGMLLNHKMINMVEGLRFTIGEEIE